MIAKDDYIRFCYLPGNWPSQVLNQIFYNIPILIEVPRCSQRDAPLLF